MARLLAIKDGRAGQANALAEMGLAGVDQIGIDDDAGGDGLLERGFERFGARLVSGDQGFGTAARPAVAREIDDVAAEQLVRGQDQRQGRALAGHQPCAELEEYSKITSASRTTGRLRLAGFALSGA